MSTLWQALTANLAVVALFISGWAHAQHWLERRARYIKTLVFAVAMGTAAVASMMLSIEVQPGNFFDLRLSIVAVSGFLGGPL